MYNVHSIHIVAVDVQCSQYTIPINCILRVQVPIYELTNRSYKMYFKIVYCSCISDMKYFTYIIPLHGKTILYTVRDRFSWPTIQFPPTL